MKVGFYQKVVVGSRIAVIQDGVRKMMTVTHLAGKPGDNWRMAKLDDSEAYIPLHINERVE